jgi:radical SAM family protein
MSTTLTAAQRLKFQLLAEGLEISRAARTALGEITGQGDLTPADYASTSGLILQLDDDVWVNAPINDYNPNFVSGSRYVLDHAADGFLVHGGGLASPAKFWAPPSYHGRTAGFGPLNNFVVTHGDRARLSPVRGCAMTCTFCNIPYDDPLDVYRTKPVDALLEATRIALSDATQPAYHLLISGGTPKRPDFGFMQEVYRRVLIEFPQAPADIMMVPLPGLLDLTELDKLGLNEISINIEVFSESHAAEVMRHKYNQGLTFYLDFIEEAAGTLGPGRVRSMLMVGLEPMEMTLAGVAAIAERGGVPVLSPFRPDPATPLRDRKPAGAAELEQTYLRAVEVAASRGAVLGPDCPPCTHNTLSFVTPGSAGAYRHPRPVMA